MPRWKKTTAKDTDRDRLVALYAAIEQLDNTDLVVTLDSDAGRALNTLAALWRSRPSTYRTDV